ncbi:MAG: hypothetical protein SGBAC_009014 [Bacillariaceae sp.]
MSISTTTSSTGTSHQPKKNAVREVPIRHSVSRSNELLSCAKTAWKIQQQQHDPAAPPLHIPNLQLAVVQQSPMSLEILEEGLTLLRAMDYGTQQLQKLVRRRGHTNDPTSEIQTLVQQLEQDTVELTNFCKSLLQKYARRRKQERKHWEFVVQWFQQVAGKYSKQLQECLKLRGEVLAEQAQQRRKLVDASSSNGNSNGNGNDKNKGNNQHQNGKKKKKTKNLSLATGASRRTTNATPLFDSPLFQNNKKSLPQARARNAPLPPLLNGGASGASGGGANSTNSTNSRNGMQSSSNHGYNGGYNGGYGGASSSNNNGGYNNYGSSSGYGGGYGDSGVGGGAYGSTGMRQRKSVANNHNNKHNNNNNNSNISGYQQQDYQQEEEEQKVQYQIQQRQQQRQTQQRVDEAQQAETALGELGQLFGKMSSLIVSQGETLEKIEDDVEAAHADVMAGQEEIAKLYSIKKGNRPLIIKTFSILIFLIIFMKGYKN